jgi:hypothetical protein
MNAAPLKLGSTSHAMNSSFRSHQIGILEGQINGKKDRLIYFFFVPHEIELMVATEGFIERINSLLITSR